MTSDARTRIQDLCSQALAATSPAEIEPILTKLRAALHDKLEDEETWMSLCEKAAVEQDPKKLLHLVDKINRRFRSKDDRTASGSRPSSPPRSQGSGSHGPSS